MVIINNTEFIIYDLDTKETIINRIAAQLDTVPRFLYFPEGEPDVFDDKTDIKVEDIIKIIKDNDDFETIFKLVNDKNISISIDEIIKIFIINNQSLNNVINNFGKNEIESYIYFINEQINNVIGNKNIDISPLLKNSQIYIDEYNNNIKKHKKKVYEKEETFKKFEEKKGIPYEAFELQEKYFEIRIIDESNLSILQIFNNIKLTEHVPFASCSDFYKIRRNHIPSINWKNVNVNSGDILLKVIQNNNNFTDVAISMDEFGLKAILQYNIKNTIPEDTLIKRYMKVLGDYEISEPKEKYIKGVFYFPNQKINKYIFSDLILNNKEFSQYLGIDEHVIPSRDSIYVYFNIKETGLVTALLTEQIVDKKNPDMRKSSFIEGSYCVRVKISIANNLKSVKKFKEILSKLFLVYNTEYENIFNFYKKFIPENEIIQVKHNLTKYLNDTKTIKFRDNLDPELYAPNYTSFCGYPPILIDDENEEEYKDNGYQILTFPKDKKEGIEPRKYICEHELYKYPGLRTNTLSNSDKFEYLPCCYKKDQRKRLNYKRYYYEQDINVNSIKQNILKTNKIVDNGQLGYLPSEIERFFYIIDNDLNSTYYRRGINRSKNSFLECVLFSLGLQDDVETIRKSLVDVSACKQEMFDYTSDDIMKKIQNLDEYFDPNLFIHLLELKYNCNILLFKRDETNPEGTLNIPRNIKGYFKNSTAFEKCIFIYENIDQNNDTPQCELICKWDKNNKKDELKRNFKYDSIITKKAINIFYKLNEFYILKDKVEYIDFQIPSNIISQSIDINGKTRKVNIEYSGKIFTIFTSPLQPYKVKEVPYFENNILPEQTIINFLNDIKAVGIKKENNIISCKIGNVHATLNLNAIEKSSSYITEYNKYKKLSRYITQYFFWLYSKYINESSETIESSETNFKNTYINIIPNFEYGYVSNNFSFNEGVMKDNKLILKSNEVFDRLYYLLKIQLLRDPLIIETYSSRTSIENYYFEISDFDTYDYQIILRGENALINFIFSNEQNKVQYILHDEIQKNILDPYFFKNSIIDNAVYLAQNTQNIENAMEIYKTWRIQKYNRSYNLVEDEESSLDGFTLYAYKNKNTIEKYYMKGVNRTSAKIVGYKILANEEGVNDEYYEEKSYFTVLLPLK